MSQDEESSAEKRRQGRPTKPDALTPAERAKRYRANKKAVKERTDIKRDEQSSVTNNAIQELRDKLVNLQMKFDVEHSRVIDLETELATLKTQAIKNAELRKTDPHPLVRQVATLQATVRDQDKIISGKSAEINKLRDALKPSRKR